VGLLVRALYISNNKLSVLTLLYLLAKISQKLITLGVSVKKLASLRLP